MLPDYYRKRKQTPPRKPSFVGQGLLIVLPAIVLVAFGLYSLRPDRLLAEQASPPRGQQMGLLPPAKSQARTATRFD